MNKCFNCNRGVGRYPRYLFCEDKHDFYIHKSCSIDRKTCTICNKNIVGYAKFKLNNDKDFINAKRNFSTKLKKLDKSCKYILDDDILNTKLSILLNTNDNNIIINKKKDILLQIKKDNIEFSYEFDLDNYLFFVINKPN